MIHQLITTWFHFTLEWGYLGIVIMMACESTALPVPAEIVVPPAAFWAAQGHFTFWGVILAATAGSWIGSALSYWISYTVGRPLIVRYGKYVLLPPEKLEKSEAWFQEYGAGGIFVARLLPGIRHIISIPAGLFRMDFRWFSGMTIAGAAVFCTFLAWFGQKVIGDRPDLMNDPTVLISVLKAKSHYLILFAVVVGVLYVIAHLMQKRLQKKTVPAE